MSRDPRQPNLLEAPSRSILDVVKEGLIGLEYRQRERDARRRSTNEKYRKWKLQRSKRAATQKPLHLENEASNVRIIRVTYCAIFKQPIGKLNPSELPFAAECPVEVFQKGDHWMVREIATPKRVVYEKLGHFPNAAGAQEAAEQNHRWVVEKWQMWGTPPCSGQLAKEHKHVARMIEPREVKVLPDGRVGWCEPEDFTHIMPVGPGLNVNGNAKEFQSHCGQMLSPKVFISTKANIPPTCKGCAEVWEREYKGK